MELDSEFTTLSTILNLEKLEQNKYRSSYQEVIQSKLNKHMVGGQLVALAMAAAGKTVEPGFNIHSFHSYFLKAGTDNPVLYDIKPLRQGKSYCSRSVTASQHGEAIFVMNCSFNKDETDPPTHQIRMPYVPPPETVKNKSQLFQDWIDETENDDRLKMMLTIFKRMAADNEVFEMRPVNPVQFRRLTPEEAKLSVWVKTREKLGDDEHVHRCAAGYVSDYYSAHVSSYIQPRKPATFPFFQTSLDHCVWFHNSFRADEWMLLDLESPIIANGRTYCTGKLWTRNGELAMSLAQESVIRTPKPKPKI